MEIHKPKATHSLREFLIEIGTIICGILIALGLEQALEAAHWRGAVREAKASIHHDLTLAAIFSQERLARLACADERLDALSAAVVASPSQWRPPSFDYCGIPHKVIYISLWRPWPTEVWRSIEASGAVAHFDEHYRVQAPFVFTFISEIGELSREERRLAAEVAPLGHPIVLTPDSRIAFLKSLAGLRSVNDVMAVYARDLNGNIRDLGETPNDAELAAQRKETPNLFVRPGVLINIPPAPRPSP